MPQCIRPHCVGDGKLTIKTMQISIDFSTIVDWQSFHVQFKQKMGFPSFYGNNMNAWIDCMSSIDAPSDGMSNVAVSKNQALDIIVNDIEKAVKTCPEVLQGFIECTALVNQRFIDSNSATRIKLVFI
jgi:RNAse (barnase) inhibitor barstar